MTTARQVLRTLCEVDSWMRRAGVMPKVLTYDEAVAEAEYVFTHAYPINMTWSWIVEIMSRVQDQAEKTRFRTWAVSKKAYIERTGGFA